MAQAPERIILAGEDSRLLPFYERLRGSAQAKVVGLGTDEPEGIVGLLALISGLPLLASGEAAPAADLWICDTAWREQAGTAPCFSFEDAERRWPLQEAVADQIEEREPQGPAIGEPVALASEERLHSAGDSAFPRELQREIQRSQRYHLGFTLSLIRVLDSAGHALGPSAFQKEPLVSLPARRGRACDSWGLSKEGYLLHLAPETLEQATSLLKRLRRALAEELEGRPGGPWRVVGASVSFPRDAEQGRDLVRTALERLERKLALSDPDEEEA